MTARLPAAAPAPVLFVHSGLNWITGSERCLLDLVAHVDRARFAPVVWCDAPALVEAAAALGVPASLSPAWGEHSGFLPRRDHIAATRAVMRRHGIRLVHANDSAPLKSLLPVALAQRVPVLAHLHLRLNADERRWSLLHQVSLAVGVSEAAVRGLRADGFPAARTAVVYNGVDHGRLAQGDATGLRASLGIAPSNVVFGVVGSLIARKGIDVVLEAFRLLGAQRGDCWLIVCGDGPEAPALRAQAESAGIADRVAFLGRLANVGAVVRDAVDALVSAARDETFGLNLAEAAVFGVPAVASDIEAHAEIFSSGDEVVLFPLNDARALADAMAALAADPARRAALGVAARERATRAFAVERYVADFEATYARLLAAPRSVYGWPRALTWPRVYTNWARSAARKQAARLLGDRPRAVG